MLFVVVVFSSDIHHSAIRRILGGTTLLIFAPAVGLSYFQDLGSWALDELRAPRLSRIVSQGEITWVSLGGILTHQTDLGLDLQQRIGAALTGFLAGLLLLGLVWLAQRVSATTISTNRLVLTAFLMAGVVIPPSVHAGVYSARCSTDFLSYYEAAGKSLSQVIPSGSPVYWKGSGRHLALLLYVDEIRVFAPQITAGGGYVVSGERDRLLRFGLFDNRIDAEWRTSAETFILWQGYPNLVMSDFKDNEAYLPLPFEMHNLAQCEDELLVYGIRP
jgi:hypothetical protein